MLPRARESQEKHRSQKLRLATWPCKARRQAAARSALLRLGSLSLAFFWHATLGLCLCALTAY